jgi:hypothetical protein
MKYLIAVLMCVFCAGFAAAGDEVGEISYLVPDVALMRGAKALKPDFGVIVENYDSITTNSKGLAEITLFPETGAAGTIRVRPNSTLHIEISTEQTGKRNSLELLSGSVFVSINKLPPQSRFEVRGQGSVMGVRGTQFEVTTSAAGDILVTCDEGRVSCEDDSGNILFAEPGIAVEHTAEGLLRDIPVRISDLETFRQNWNLEKISVFKSNANRAINEYAGRYINLKTQFDLAYRNLLAQKTILDKWYREDSRNQIGSTTDVMKEKTALIKPLMNIKRIAFLFEPIYYRLFELEELHKQGHGKGSAGNMTTDQFFLKLSNESVELRERMANIRYILKLYAKRNGGSVPLE